MSSRFPDPLPSKASGACPGCTPARAPAIVAGTVAPAASIPARNAGHDLELVQVGGGEFMMGNHQGDGYLADGETPVHPVRLDPFLIAPETVTNARFSDFVTATGYRTEAEAFGWSFVFAGFLPGGTGPTSAAVAAPWWRQVFGADWRRPEGPYSDLAGRASHPVTHVSWNDTMAYCAWAGTRLPTEAEWECAARAGTEASHFWWGDQLIPNGKHRMNVWQGAFPEKNRAADGYAGTAPANAYAPNSFGLYNMTGNVWEWCADWFDAGYYARSPVDNPPGAETGPNRVMRGGSYLCHKSYCNRYRVDSRSSNTPDSSAGNIGFRVARSLPPAS